MMISIQCTLLINQIQIMLIQTSILILNEKIKFFCESYDKKKIITLCKIIIDDLIDVNLEFFSFKLFVKFGHLIFLNQFFLI